MSDRPERDRDLLRRIHSSGKYRSDVGPSRERARVESALARADEHSVRELYFLELALQAPDDHSARTLELYAYEAYRDAVAIAEEHDLEL